MRSILFALALSSFAFTQHDVKDHAAHEQMEKRGNQGMGFDQKSTTHHFLLANDGGAIDVSVNDPKDIDNLRAIRAHLTIIAQAFKSGDFKIPGFVHDKPVPGTKTMTELKDQIDYRFAETERGGRVTISTKNKQALKAVHDFLRFQITEHRTGDPLQPPAAKSK